MSTRHAPGPPGIRRHRDTFNYQWYEEKVMGVSPQQSAQLEADRKAGRWGALPGWLRAIIGQNMVETNAANRITTPIPTILARAIRDAHPGLR